MRALGFTACVVAASTACSAISGQAPDRERQIRAIFEPLADGSSPGFAVYARDDTGLRVSLGFGVGELASKKPIDARTNFRIASNSKQLTAMAVMLLVHDGRLDYETKLNEVFPEFPAYGKDISVRELLHHTSGLVDYEAIMDEAEPARWTPQHQIQSSDVLALMETQRTTLFAPGSRWQYSNSGYVLLGLIVAKRSGQSLPDFLHDRIFAPLHMDNTVAYVKGANQITERAYGHSRRGNGWKQDDQSAGSATLGDGGVYSNLDDLAKWDDALREHALLREAEMQAAYQPVKIAGAPVLPYDAPPSLTATNVSYGFGWFLNPYKTYQRTWHYGDTTGFKSSVQRFSQKHLTVVVLTNRTDGDPTALALRVADLLL